MRKDIVFHTIQREYNSRLLNVARDENRLNEIQAQCADLRQAIIDNKIYVAELERFATEQGWDAKDLRRPR